MDNRLNIVLKYFEELYTIIAKTVQTEVYVAPCLDCGSHDIRLEDCGYSKLICLLS